MAVQLRTVLLALSARWEAGAKLLAGRLEREGISCREYHKTEDRKKAEARHTIVITDDRALARELDARHFFCIGCDSAEGSYFEGAGMVTDTLGALEAEALEEYLLRSLGLPVTVARTQRLILREISGTDFFRLRQISRQKGMEHLQAEEDGDFFEPRRLKGYVSWMYRLYGFGLWSVYEKKEERLIGCCGFSPWEQRDSDSRLELQYMLDQLFGGRGYGREMCHAALEYAWRRMEAGEVWLRIRRDNRPSLRLAGKLGFVSAGDDGGETLYYVLRRPSKIFVDTGKFSCL